MTKQLVSIINRVDTNDIRRIKNGRGDEVIVVPSKTLPDDCVMNNILYPASETEKSYHTLEGKLSPIGHPFDENGNYISANEADAINYFYGGAVTRNVQRVAEAPYGHRVHSEIHINTKVARQTENGRKLLDAIERRQPIHTSTGVLLKAIPGRGVNSLGQEYEFIASECSYDHNAILLDEDGAATPEDGVGIFVNHKIVSEFKRDGATFAVHSVKANESYNDMREQLQALVAEQHDEAWLTDFGDDYVVFDKGQSSYRVRYAKDGELQLIGEPEEVKRVTMWEAITNAAKKVFSNRDKPVTQTNQEGEDMSMKDMLKERLGDAYNEDMTEEEMLNAYDKMLKGNAADQQNQPAGEQGQPKGETVVNADIEKLVTDAVQKALAANKQAEEASKREALAEQLKANGVELEDADLKSMSVNALQKMVDKTKPASHAFGLPGGQLSTNSQESRFDADLPE